MTLSLVSLILASVLPISIVYFMPKDRTWYHKPAVRGFGLGVYAALVILLFREGSEHGAGEAVLWGAVGLAISIAIGFFYKEFHHHHTDTEHAHSHTRSSTTRILVSDFFHNIVDGIAILSGFAIGGGAGILSLLGVVGHQMIQQAGQQVLLVDGGMSPRRALLVSFFISLSLGLGYFFQTNEELEHILIALSAGIVAWKVGTDILHTNWNTRSVFGFFIGMLLLSLTLLAIPHAH